MFRLLAREVQGLIALSSLFVVCMNAERSALPSECFEGKHCALREERFTCDALLNLVSDLAVLESGGLCASGRCRGWRCADPPGHFGERPARVSPRGIPHPDLPLRQLPLGRQLERGAINTDAIDITAENVTLDLNGFTISGPSVCSGPPVQCTNVGTGKGILSQVRGTTVRNGTVRGFGTGVLLGSLAVADGVHAESNSDVNSGGIWVGDGLVIHCTSNINAGSGIIGGTVTSFNSATANGAFGIFGGATVNNNTVSSNGLDGIHDAFTMLFNTSSSNVGAGITTGFIDAGYLGNVVLGNQGGTISGGHSLGHNLCDGVAC